MQNECVTHQFVKTKSNTIAIFKLQTDPRFFFFSPNEIIYLFRYLEKASAFSFLLMRVFFIIIWIQLIPKRINCCSFICKNYISALMNNSSNMFLILLAISDSFHSALPLHCSPLSLAIWHVTFFASWVKSGKKKCFTSFCFRFSEYFTFFGV